MKKEPMHQYNKETNSHPYIGVMTEGSRLREQTWLNQGCNAFENKIPQSTPLAFWTKSDVLHYIVKYNVPYVKEIYGDIIEQDGIYTTTKQKRTGCIFCGFGCHLEHSNRFQILEKTHPNLYDYCMRGGKLVDGVWQPNKGLGMAYVLDYIGVTWWNNEETRDRYRKGYRLKIKGE